MAYGKQLNGFPNTLTLFQLILHDERSVLSLLDFIFSVFREKFGDMIIEVKRLPMIHELWVRVVVKERTKEMEELAHEIEKEMDELGRHVTIFIKKQRWKPRLLGWRNRDRGKTNPKTVGSEAS
jgi:hypothetical protein